MFPLSGPWGSSFSPWPTQGNNGLLVVSFSDAQRLLLRTILTNLQEHYSQAVVQISRMSCRLTPPNHRFRNVCTVMITSVVLRILWDWFFEISVPAPGPLSPSEVENQLEQSKDALETTPINTTEAEIAAIGLISSTGAVRRNASDVAVDDEIKPIAEIANSPKDKAESAVNSSKEISVDAENEPYPCILHVNATSFQIMGSCTDEEIKMARAKYIGLQAEAQKLEAKIDRENYQELQIETKRKWEERTKAKQEKDEREQTEFREWLRIRKFPATDNKWNPCKIAVSETAFIINGKCSVNEIGNAKRKHTKLLIDAAEDRRRRQKESGDKAVQDSLILKELDDYIEQLRNRIATMGNDPPLTADEMDDQLFRGYPGYTSKNEDAPTAEQPRCSKNEGTKIENRKYRGLTPEELASIEEIDPFCPEDAAIILGVPADTSQKDIEKAFRQLSKLYHSDRSNSQGALRAFYLITQARETLLTR